MESPTEVSHPHPHTCPLLSNEESWKARLQSPLFFKGQQIASSPILIGYLPNSNFRSRGKKVQARAARPSFFPLPPSSISISAQSVGEDDRGLIYISIVAFTVLSVQNRGHLAGAGNEKKGFTQQLMRHRGFSAWVIQTGPLAAL